MRRRGRRDHRERRAPSIGWTRTCSSWSGRRTVTTERLASGRACVIDATMLMPLGMSCFCRIATQSGTLREDIAGHCTIVRGSGGGCRGCSGSRMQGSDTRVGDGDLRESQSWKPSSLDGQCVCLCVYEHKVHRHLSEHFLHCGTSAESSKSRPELSLAGI